MVRLAIVSAVLRHSVSQDTFLAISPLELEDLTCDVPGFQNGRISRSPQISQLTTEDAGDCCVACDDEPLCSHFVYLHLTKACELKHGEPDWFTPSEVGHVLSGEPAKPIFRAEAARGTSFSPLSGVCDPSGYQQGRGTKGGIKIRQLSADLAGGCCTACDEEDQCSFWTFVPEEKACKLKKGDVTWWDDPKTQSYTSGAAGPAPPPAPPPAPVPPTPAWTGPQPHIIFMLGDDVGHYNFGFRGNIEARTPNIDELVKEGVVLDRHYVFQFCSPTRTSFLSGRLPVHSSTTMGGIPDKVGVHVKMTTVAQRLSERGYATHHLGKWHAGSALEGQLPANKGFHTSLGYLSGNEDHYTQTTNGHVDFWENDAPAYNEVGRYGGFIYTERAVAIIQQHDPSTPLFMYLAWQNAHTPNQVPASFLQDAIDFDLRRTYEGMIHCLDSGIGNVTAALKTKSMWENTLMIFSADNGGREDGKFGGNNWPLRGMKFSDFEGGVRASAFASGGLIPHKRRNSVEPGLIHVADWYATFCNLAGCSSSSDPAAASGEFPDVDGVDQVWTVLQGDPSPRQQLALPISKDTLIQWPYKLVLGKQGGKGIHTGPQHPNATKVKTNDPGCGSSGCLFNIEDDPSEFVDLSGSESDLLQELRNTLSGLSRGFYEYIADVSGKDPVYSSCTSIDEFAKAHNNFIGPVCSAP